MLAIQEAPLNNFCAPFSLSKPIFTYYILHTILLVQWTCYCVIMCDTDRLIVCLFCLFVSHLWRMGLNVLGYQSHLLQRCHHHPVIVTVNACGHEGYFHLSPVLALRFFIAMRVHHSTGTFNTISAITTSYQ